MQADPHVAGLRALRRRDNAGSERGGEGVGIWKLDSAAATGANSSCQSEEPWSSSLLLEPLIGRPE